MGTVSRRFEHINSSPRRAAKLPATAASGKHRFAVGYTNGGTEERNRCVYILIKSGSVYLKLGRPHQQRLATHNCRAICLTLSMLCTGGALPTCALLHNYESNHLLPVALLLLPLMIIIIITSSSSPYKCWARREWSPGANHLHCSNLNSLVGRSPLTPSPPPWEVIAMHLQSMVAGGDLEPDVFVFLKYVHPLTAYNNGHVQASKSPSTNDCSDEKDIPPSQQCHVKEVRNGDADHKCSHNPDPANAIPIDWDPSEKCNFCDEGKLFAVNDKGELVPETGSGNTGPDPTNTVSDLFLCTGTYAMDRKSNRVHCIHCRFPRIAKVILVKTGLT